MIVTGPAVWGLRVRLIPALLLLLLTIHVNLSRVNLLECYFLPPLINFDCNRLLSF